MDSVILGIDLGTTFSLVGAMIDGVPTLIPNQLDEILIPSAVFVNEDSSVIVGSPAKSKGVLAPERLAVHFKRDMGTDKTYKLGNKIFRPEELSSLILIELRKMAETFIGKSCTKAVISVPAYFGEAQRQATRAACEIAGLQLLRLINEPTAAAIAFGVDRTDKESKVVVLDLGGGTFDVTLLEIFEGIQIVASSGDVKLGGIDFDTAITKFAINKLSELDRRPSMDPLTQSRIMLASERAKKALSNSAHADITIVDLQFEDGSRGNVKIPISISDAHEAFKELEIRLKKPIEVALTNANWKVEDVEEILLVGGSSRLQIMANLALEFFGKFALKSVQPDQAVAIGVILTAGLMGEDDSLSDLVVTDIAPFTLGTDIGQMDEHGKMVDDIYFPLIERGTIIPCSRSELFHPLSEKQPIIQFNIFQGEHSIASKNTKLDSLQIAVPRGENRSVKCRFTYDISGLLEVDVEVLATGEKKSLLIKGNNTSMTPEEIEQARKKMSSLKIDPEDETLNAHILNQADELYTELSGEQRSFLGQALSEFRMVLKSQDKQKIIAGRNTLRKFIEDIKRNMSDNEE